MSAIILKFFRRKPVGFNLTASLARTQQNDPIGFYPRPEDAGQGLIDQVHASTDRGDVRRLFAKKLRSVL